MRQAAPADDRRPEEISGDAPRVRHQDRSGNNSQVARGVSLPREVQRTR